MDTYSKVFEEAIAAIPHTILAEMIRAKLDAQGVKLSKKKIELMAEKISKGEPPDGSSFLNRLKEKLGFAVQETVIGFTSEDLNAVQTVMAEFIKNLPQAIQGILAESSPVLLEALKERWPAEAKRQNSERKAFGTRLYERWGDGLHLLRMLITIAREVGSEINGSGGKTGDAPLTAGVLTRLHARACQISEEIVCLLESGFADGAMARWRTLHEISAVSSLIGQHGEELAERYIEHDAIESARAARQYQTHHVRLGQEAIAPDEIAEIEERSKTLTAKYGKHFGAANGWAAKHLGMAEPTFAQIIEAAGIDHLSPYYRLASHNVHANPKGIFFKLGIIGEAEVLLAGSSNAGLADPGHSTAISLMQITTSVALSNPTLDHLIAIKTIQKLVDEIGGAFIDAHDELERDHAEFERMTRP